MYNCNIVGMCSKGMEIKAGKENSKWKEGYGFNFNLVQGRLTEIWHLAKYLKEGSEVC